MLQFTVESYTEETRDFSSYTPIHHTPPPSQAGGDLSYPPISLRRFTSVSKIFNLKGAFRQLPPENCCLIESASRAVQQFGKGRGEEETSWVVEPQRPESAWRSFREAFTSGCCQMEISSSTFLSALSALVKRNIKLKLLHNSSLQSTDNHGLN